MKKFFKEFKDFAIGGNLIDMAIGVIVGGAFNAVVGSLVADIFTPLLGMLFGSSVDFSELMLGQIKIGNFINSIITFLLTALCLFSVIKALNAAKAAAKKEEEAKAAEPAPAEPSDEVKLLTEIKDLLKKNSK
ncbi:MAG: large conductance mechanosensitive channel protein MscL [Erysipelotrichaceae bacterium]|nr:large conductance mechanosensitive channel protein MscL [Erysipelotrichaceae bacterium]